MKLRVEISMYPLKEDFIPAIDDFISRLNVNKAITVWTNDLSTHIIGDYEVVMQVLSQEMKISFEDSSKVVFVTKFHSPGS